MAFRPLFRDEGEVILVPATASEAFTKGAALTYASGLVTAAAAGTATDIYFIAAETITVGSGGGFIKAWPTVNVIYEADVDTTWATADQGTLADLASASTINPDASDNDLFWIFYGLGETGVGTKVVGRFMHANET